METPCQASASLLYRFELLSSSYRLLIFQLSLHRSGSSLFQFWSMLRSGVAMTLSVRASSTLWELFSNSSERRSSWRRLEGEISSLVLWNSRVHLFRDTWNWFAVMRRWNVKNDLKCDEISTFRQEYITPILITPIEASLGDHWGMCVPGYSRPTSLIWQPTYMSRCCVNEDLHRVVTRNQ